MQDAPCDPCMVHCCLHWCALCQEQREVKHHLSDNSPYEDTVVNPPAIQEMIAGEEVVRESNVGESNLQLQPM